MFNVWTEYVTVIVFQYESFIDNRNVPLVLCGFLYMHQVSYLFIFI
jgi:hypothetical protein